MGDAEGEPDMTHSAMKARVSVLLDTLDHGDLFGREAKLAEVRALGHEAIPLILEEADLGRVETALREVIEGLEADDREKACSLLVRALRRDRPEPLRMLVLWTIGKYLADLTSYIDRFVEIALDSTEIVDMRVSAFRFLRAKELPREHVRDIGRLVDIKALGPDCPGPLRDVIFACLKAHADQLSVELTMRGLEPFLTHPDPSIRVHALALLGEVGDLDAIEGMCLLPNTAEEIDRIQQAIGRILLRPTNLFALRWEHFEHFIGHLLRKMEHTDVKVVGKVKDDGVDLTSCKPRENAKGVGVERWAVQCKRWTTKDVDVKVLEDLVAASRTTMFNAKHALLITTSGFTKRALKYAEEHSSAIELVSGAELLEILTKHFGKGRYTIRNRA